MFMDNQQIHVTIGVIQAEDSSLLVKLALKLTWLTKKALK